MITLRVGGSKLLVLSWKCLKSACDDGDVVIDGVEGLLRLKEGVCNRPDYDSGVWGV